MAYEFFDIEMELERLIPAIAVLATKEFYSQGIVSKELIDLRREFYWLLGSRRIARTYDWENKLNNACYAKRMELLEKILNERNKDEHL